MSSRSRWSRALRKPIPSSLQKAAHRLKGSSGLLPGDAVCELADCLEIAALAGNAVQAGAVFGELEGELRRCLRLDAEAADLDLAADSPIGVLE